MRSIYASQQMLNVSLSLWDLGVGEVANSLLGRLKQAFSPFPLLPFKF